MQEMAVTFDLPFLLPIPRYFTRIACATYAATLLGMLRHIVGWLLRSAPSPVRP
jgi:hypothetical protein